MNVYLFIYAYMAGEQSEALGLLRVNARKPMATSADAHFGLFNDRKPEIAPFTNV